MEYSLRKGGKMLSHLARPLLFKMVAWIRRHPSFAYRVRRVVARSPRLELRLKRFFHSVVSSDSGVHGMAFQRDGTLTPPGGQNCPPAWLSPDARQIFNALARATG